MLKLLSVLLLSFNRDIKIQDIQEPKPLLHNESLYNFTTIINPINLYKTQNEFLSNYEYFKHKIDQELIKCENDKHNKHNKHNKHYKKLKRFQDEMNIFFQAKINDINDINDIKYKNECVLIHKCNNPFLTAYSKVFENP